MSTCTLHFQTTFWCKLCREVQCIKIAYNSMNLLSYQYLRFAEQYEDPEIQVAIDKGKIVNILYDSGR
jgi:hypothetical protein